VCQWARAYNLAMNLLFLKKQIDVSFSCVLGWVYECMLSPWGSTATDNVMAKFMINNVQDRCKKNWHQFVKLKKIRLLVFLWLMEVSKSSQLFNFSDCHLCLYFLRWLPPGIHTPHWHTIPWFRWCWTCFSYL